MASFSPKSKKANGVSTVFGNSWANELIAVSNSCLYFLFNLDYKIQNHPMKFKENLWVAKASDKSKKAKFLFLLK